MKLMRPDFFSWFLLIVLIGLVGCGGGEKPKLISKAEGTLKNGETPIPNIRVTFNPENDKFPTAFGITNENGFFSLKLSDTGKPGAVVGKNKVTLAIERTGPRGVRKEDEDGKESIPSKDAVPKQFLTAAKSPIEVNVESGKYVYDVDIQGK